MCQFRSQVPVFREMLDIGHQQLFTGHVKYTTRVYHIGSNIDVREDTVDQRGRLKHLQTRSAAVLNAYAYRFGEWKKRESCGGASAPG